MATFRRTRKRAVTSKTSWARTTAIAVAERLAVALVLAALAGAPSFAASNDAPSIATIFAAYDAATHASDVASIESQGTIAGEGLTGTFHTWRRGDDERDDESLGPRVETTLRHGARVWTRNANGNVHELRGVLLRRELTDEYVDTGAFLRAPDRATFLGYGTIGRERAWRVQVAAPGGDPETLWIGVDDGLPLRTQYVDGDGVTDVDFTDWRHVGGQTIAFRSLTTDGDHAFDLVEQTTDVNVGAAIADERFAPLDSRSFDVAGVQEVPLLELGGHVGCTVQIEGRSFAFLLDTGAQSILLDARVAQSLHLAPAGAMEVRGAVRTGGLQVARLPRLSVGEANLDDLVVSTIDLRPTFGGPAIDGILGYPFFASGLVQLDFAHRVLRFGPAGSFAPPGERIALDVDREVPEAPVRVDAAVDAPFIIDTGNSGELLIYRPFVDAHPGVVPIGGARSVNYGVGGSDAAYRTTLALLRIGDIPLARLPADVVTATNGAFADRVDGGNIGLMVLRNFTVTFDLANDAMYLLPNGGATPQRAATTP